MVELLIAVPVTMLITGGLVLWAVYMGLKWQIQTKEGKEPDKPVTNPLKPIADVFQAKAEQTQAAKMQSLMDEWLNGEKGSEDD